MTVFRNLKNQTVVKAVNVACYMYASHGPNRYNFSVLKAIFCWSSKSVLQLLWFISCLDDWLNRSLHFLKQTYFDQLACTCLAPVKFSVKTDWLFPLGLNVILTRVTVTWKMFKAVQVSFTTWKSLHCHSTVFQLVHVLSGDYFYISA